MSVLAYKMLLRKRGAALSILAMALLVAVLASMNSIINAINLQAQTLGGLVSPGRTCIILSRNSTSVMDSRVDVDLAHKLSSFSYVENVLPQKILTVTITKGSDSRAVYVRGVEGVSVFLGARGAYINGTAAESLMEANVGEMLARAFSISLGDELGIAFGDKHVKVRAVGVFRSQTRSDAELVVPMETANMLDGNNGAVSLIEFSLKEGVNSREAISQIARFLPEKVKLIQAQQLKEFLRQMNMQTVAFLNLWGMVVYVAVAAASHVIATRLIIESSYELAMLRALGAKKHLVSTLVLTYTITIAFLSSILGIALGTAGAQTVSTILKWIQPSTDITPFLESEQALRILLLTFASSILGCIYPAFRSTHVKYTEQPLYST
jgi:ABC-type lipoprotein release transport system permease subunit